MAENPIAPGWGSKSSLSARAIAGVFDHAAEMAYYGGFENSAFLMWNYLLNTGRTAYIDFHQMFNDAPRSVERAINMEFDSALEFLKDETMEEGVYNIYSTDATKRVRSDKSIPYPYILEEGVPILSKESPDWFLATNDFAIWGDGSVKVMCDPYGKKYSVTLNIHFFDLYDWEPNPGEPPGVGISVGPFKISDAQLRELYLAGVAKYIR